MSNSNSDFILVEDLSGNSVQTSTPDVVEELCTTDCHTENCSCFQKQEEKIKQLQEQLKKEQQLLDEQRRRDKEKKELAIKKQKVIEEKKKQDEEKKKQDEEKKKQDEEKKKTIEDLRNLINVVVVQTNEQKKIAQDKYKEWTNAENKYSELDNYYWSLKSKYDRLTGVYNNYPFDSIFKIFFDPSLYNIKY